MPFEYDHDHEREITLFAETNFRNQRRRFGIKTDDRRRHMYVLGKTGMGKTTLLENLILSDINAGHGCCYVDPHGDTAEKLIDWIPSHRLNDVVYFNPADTAYPMGFNILEVEDEEQKTLVASGLMGVFKKIWPDVWSARMEYILINCVLALLDYPGSTLMGISRLLVDEEYRMRVTAKIRDPIVKTFWAKEFTSWSEKYATEAIAPVQNKVGQFLSSSTIRNIVAQVKSTINFRSIMDEGKICIVNLSKGRIGEDNMRLLGGMVVTKIQLAAQERQNIPERERRDFYLYVDEFQNFANESFATILSEARKYRLNLIVAHQYVEQLDEETRAAVIGNVGTLALMRIGGPDATFFETEFAPTFTPEDMVNLAKYQLYLKLMVDGVSTPPFSANTLPPISQPVGSKEKVIKVSRERYAEPKDIIQQKILKWSGFQVPGVDGLQSAKDESLVFAPVGTIIAHDPSAPPRDANAETSSAQSLKFPTIKTEDELEADAREHEHHEEILQFSPEQQAAIAKLQEKAVSSGRKKRPSYTHVCTRCGKTWELAIQLDPSRPMYCPECKPIVAAERKAREAAQKSVVHTPPPPESEVAPHHASDEGSFVHQSPEPVAPSRVRVVQDAPSPREQSERPRVDERSRDDGRPRERRRERDRDRDRRRGPERERGERRDDRRDERLPEPKHATLSTASQPSNATRVLERLRDQRHEGRSISDDETGAQPPSTAPTVASKPLDPDTHVRF